jgi:hypothetical protein
VRVLAFALCAVLLWGLTVVYLEGTYRQQCAGDVDVDEVSVGRGKDGILADTAPHTGEGRHPADRKHEGTMMKHEFQEFEGLGVGVTLIAVIVGSAVGVVLAVLFGLTVLPWLTAVLLAWGLS